MTKKMMLLAIAAVAAIAFAAVPALASAATPEMDPSAGFPQAFTGTSGVSTLSTGGGTSVTCKKDKNIGSQTSATTGTIEITFEECESLGVKCKSSGQVAGTITTTELVYHLVYLNTATKTPGVLITPKEGHFASFTCSFLVSVVVGGNGILGHLSAPACGASSTGFTTVFSTSAPGIQNPVVEGEGKNFHLEATVNGTLEPAGQQGTGTETWTGGKTAKLTCP
jgi:hypothetical protein